jgi:transcription antitermination factor NusG
MSLAQWYAIRVKSNRERVTVDALRGRDMEVCFPTYRERRISGNRARTVELPLFSGYVFCRFDVGNRLPIMTVPGVVHIVGLGSVPQPVDPNEMASVFALLQADLSAAPHPYATGRRVRIHAGPLRGVEGVVVAHSDATKLVVSVTLLQRSIAVNLDPQWVQVLSDSPTMECADAHLQQLRIPPQRVWTPTWQERSDAK